MPPHPKPPSFYHWPLRAPGILLPKYTYRSFAPSTSITQRGAAGGDSVSPRIQSMPVRKVQKRSSDTPTPQVTVQISSITHDPSYSLARARSFPKNCAFELAMPAYPNSFVRLTKKPSSCRQRAHGIVLMVRSPGPMLPALHERQPPGLSGQQQAQRRLHQAGERIHDKHRKEHHLRRQGKHDQC